MEPYGVFRGGGGSSLVPLKLLHLEKNEILSHSVRSHKDLYAAFLVFNPAGTLSREVLVVFLGPGLGETYIVIQRDMRHCQTCTPLAEVNTLKSNLTAVENL